MDTHVVFATIGTFDGLHLGHQALLEELRHEASARGMRPAVVTFDPVPSAVLAPDKMPAQLYSTSERVALLRAMGFETIILLNFQKALAQLSPLDFMQLLRDKYAVGGLLLGYDHHFGRREPGGATPDYVALGQTLGIEVLRSEALVLGGEVVSSSRVRHCLSMGKTREANELLGRLYSLSGQVVGGMQIGRSLGYPTANIKPEDPQKLIPADGVYAVHIWLDRCACGERCTRYDGMLYIGDRPTLGGGLARTIEVNIFDLSADLYAQRIRLEFVDYIRPNIRFASLEELTAQIARDEVQIRQVLKGA